MLVIVLLKSFRR